MLSLCRAPQLGDQPAAPEIRGGAYHPTRGPFPRREPYQRAMVSGRIVAETPEGFNPSDQQPAWERRRSMFWDGTRWIDQRTPQRRAKQPPSWMANWLSTAIMVLCMVALAIPLLIVANSPHISLSPSAGTPGTRITADLSGLVPGTTVGLTWDGTSTVMASGTVSRRGLLRLRFTVPTSVPGTHQVAAMTVSPSTRGKSRLASLVPAGFVLAMAAFSVGGQVEQPPDPTPVPTVAPTAPATPRMTPAPTAAATPTPAATPTALPTPVPALVPTPEPPPPSTPAPTPPSAGPGCTRTATADATGATDVTGALASEMNATPALGTFCLRAGGTYTVNGQLHFTARNGLTIEGNGATLRQTVELNSAILLFDHGGNDINVRNLVIQGGNRQPGTYRAGLEYGHGIQLEGVVRASIQDVSFNNVGGDAIYIRGGTAPAVFREAQSITVSGNAINGTGRMGIAITDGAAGVTIQGNSFAGIPLYAFDIEPNGHVFNNVRVGAHDVLFTGNTYYPGAVAHMVALVGDGGDLQRHNQQQPFGQRHDPHLCRRLGATTPPYLHHWKRRRCLRQRLSH